MDWYGYTKTWASGLQKRLAQRMSKREAREKGAVLLENFDPATAARDLLVLSFTSDGQLERCYSVRAEAPPGRLA